MGPRFIESKKRGKSTILRGKGNRNVRRKVTQKDPAVPKQVEGTIAATPNADFVYPNTIESRKENFIGGELLELDHSMRKTTEDGRTSTEQIVQLRMGARTPVPQLARPRRCLGFDTRALHDVTSGQRYGEISNDMNKFMDHLSIRGYHVPVRASSVSDPSKRDKIQSVDKESGITRMLSYVSTVGVSATTIFSNDPLDDTPIEAKVAFENGVVKLKEIPNTLTAEFTWNLIADLVQAIIGKKANDKGKEPQRITILSSELAFFADADLKSHVAAFDLFVKRLSPLYSDGQIDSVQIVLVSCGSVSSTKNDGSDEDFPTICTSTLRRKMEDLEYQPLVSTFEGKQISIERIGSSEIESLALARRWVRESICGHDHHLTLDLPETSDGSQCSVTFDISYELCPISLTSPYMNDLISDLKCIATHGLEVVQRLPLSSLDASLLFGVPFVLQAGLDGDLDQYRETQTIVSTLLRLLDDRGEALMLSLKKTSMLGMSDTCGLFVAGTPGPRFIFMAKHNANCSPTKATLFRISSDTDLLAEAGTSSCYSPALNDDAAVQYAAFIESSLSSLPTNAFNPMAPPRETRRQSRPSAMANSRDLGSSSNFHLTAAHDDEEDET